jgi:methylated-DNA-[protein]-cysteine S-methyltransferase
MVRKRTLETVRYRSLFETALGFGALIAGDKGIVEVFLPFSGESEDPLAKRILLLYPFAVTENRVTMEAAISLQRYFAGEDVSFNFPIDRSCFTPFQGEVYEMVSRIPYGSVKSYGDIAALIGRPKAARGVGSAMARNPLPIIIPCHRVVGSSGDLTGYSAAGGVYSKKWLLHMEGALILGKNGSNERIDVKL